MRKHLEGSKAEVHSTSATLLFCVMLCMLYHVEQSLFFVTLPPLKSFCDHQLCLIVTKLEGERSTLETQLTEAKVGFASIMPLHIPHVFIS